MILKEINITQELLMRRFVEFEVPALAFNFHAYSSKVDSLGESYSNAISYCACETKGVKIVKFQFADIGQEIENGAVFVGSFVTYGVHVFLIP
jgi:hypothetical protein